MADKYPRVITNEVRLSYFFGWEAKESQDDGPAKFSTVIVWSKKDKATTNLLRKAQQEALQIGKDTIFKGKLPKVWKDTIHDGDEEADLDKNPEYEGCYYMSVSSVRRPGIVDRQANVIMDRDEVYSGCYARVSLTCFPYSTKGNTGVSFGLNNIQKLRDGDPLSGGPSAASEFDALDDEDEDDLI